MASKDSEKKTQKELQTLLAEERAKLFELKTKVSVNQIKDVREIREVRVLIARILTRLHQVVN